MSANHNFNFDYGEILTRMGAWWFVSYCYYLNIDKYYDKWLSISSKYSLDSRKNNYGKSTENMKRYWLEKVLEMQNLDIYSNSANLKANEIKQKAKELLKLKKII